MLKGEDRLIKRQYKHTTTNLTCKVKSIEMKISRRIKVI